MQEDRQVTMLLRRWRDGDEQAGEQVVEAVYGKLRSIAQRCMHAERYDHTLQPTALVHEAFVDLAGADIPWQDRAHFLAVAARSMRRILVDYARRKQTEKRGAGQRAVALEDVEAVLGSTSTVVGLDAALDKLAAFDKRKSDIVELIFFGGLPADEAAAVVGISRATLFKELKLAKAWLYHELYSQPEPAE